MSTIELLQATGAVLLALIFWGGVIVVSGAALNFLIEGAKLFKVARERIERTGS